MRLYTLLKGIFHVCRNLLAQFQREETQLFVLRVMVGLVILYDHVHPQGAFVKGSNVDVSIKLFIYCMPEKLFDTCSRIQRFILYYQR